ncbi:MAG: hypothetical protein FJ087_07735 [Deltaproteobacteria bacterium]|nr:hypothetical protein [Deltaproteobacteria bacterium]
MGDSGDNQRRPGELAQPGCAMTGYAFVLAGSDPGIALVIFGERDCANAFPRLDPRFSALPRWNVWSAGLRETDVVAGAAEERLRGCLREVAASRPAPRIVLVLSTCVADVVGADPGPVCAAVEAETGVRIVPAAAGGIRPRTQIGVADEVATLLLDELGRRDAAPDPKAVALVGYPTGRAPDPSLDPRTFRAEAAGVLAGLGLRLAACVPEGAALADWEALPGAGVVAVPDRAALPGLIERLDRPGCVVAEVPVPVGVEAADAFHAAVAAACRVPAAPVQGLPSRALAADAIAAARARLSGRRLAYGIGSHHNFRAGHLAWEGLGDLPLFRSLGFEVDLVVQERDTPEARARIERGLAAAGLDLPYHLFREPAVLAPVLRAGRFDVAYLSDFLADQAVAAGVPIVPLGRIRPGYAGAADACGEVLRAVTGGFRERYARWLAPGRDAPGRDAPGREAADRAPPGHGRQP